MALERVAFLPFGLLIDLYRYDLFSGKVPETKWNAHWEHLRFVDFDFSAPYCQKHTTNAAYTHFPLLRRTNRETYQKVRSPVKRNETHFDAGAKFHVPADSAYMPYFFAHILEFQLLRALCQQTGQFVPNDPKKPLHKCDLYTLKEPGERLRAGLSLGISKHWSEALRAITDETALSADAILEYFGPLDRFLQEKISGTFDIDIDFLSSRCSIKQTTDNFYTFFGYSLPARSAVSKTPYIIGGSVIGICLVALTAFGIYKYNQK